MSTINSELENIDLDPVQNEQTDEVIEQEMAQEEGVQDTEDLELIESSEVEGSELEEFDSESVEELEMLDDTQVVSILESVLFATDKAQGLGVFKQIFKGTDVNSARIKKQLEALKVEYAGGSRGVTLEETTGGYQLRTKPDNMTFIKRMVKGRSFKLSGPALEVLSIVAYKQPCIKSHVDEIRGVESGHILRGLMDRGMVNFAGKSELPGKPMMYGTSRKFLEIFGLRNLNELPSLSEIDELLPEGIEEENEKNETLDQLSTQLSKEAIESYSESEEELGKITDQLSEISSSTEFFEQEKIRQKKERDAMRAQDIEDAITVGEEVPAKDHKWLDKYKAAMAAALAESQVESEVENGVEGSLSNDESEGTAESVSLDSSGEVIEVESNMESVEVSEASVEEPTIETITSISPQLVENFIEDEAVEFVAIEGVDSEVVDNTKLENVESDASKIGDVDISSLKDDIDFLG